MLINFSKITRDHCGNIEKPKLFLKTLDNKRICSLGSYFNLSLNLKYNEVSEASFSVPAHDDGCNTPYYDRVTGKKLVDIYPYGIFILNNPEIETDGVREVKNCSAKSLEYELAHKNFVIEKGTYQFYNPVDPKNTIIGRIHEIAPNWSIGAVDESLLTKWRTFDDLDVNLLTFMLETLQELYDIVFVFNTYTREISVKAGATQAQHTPISLSFNNLIKDVNNKQLSEDIQTVIRVYGASPLSINNVNPMGDNKIYNIDYFIENGDIPPTIVTKWRSWQTAYNSAILTFSNINVLLNVATARKITENARLVDMKAEQTSLENVRSAIIKGIAEGLKTQSDLDAINVKINAQKTTITKQETLIASIQKEIDSHNTERKSINDSVKFSAFFTAEEMTVLSAYFVEGSFTDSTFATVDIGTYTDKGSTQNMKTATVGITGSKLTSIALPSTMQKTIVDVIGGAIKVTSGTDIFTAKLISGTMEHKANGENVWSFYVGDGKIRTETFPSGNVTFVCKSPDFGAIAQDKITVNISDAYMYFTKNVTDYQAFSIEKELFEYATEELKKISYPSYEFTVESGNLVFAQGYEAFKNALQLGSTLNLKLNNDIIIKPMLLEISLNFDDLSKAELVFSNKYKRPDEVTRQRDLQHKANSSAQTLNSSGKGFSSWIDSGASNSIRDFMKSSFDAMSNSVIAGNGKGVVIDGAGIKITEIGENGLISPEQIGINNNAIAFTNDNWAHANVGIGKFHDKNLGMQYGIMAPSVVGTLIAGENCMFECTGVDGIKKFIFNKNGAYLYNSQMFVQSDKGGAAMIDPSFGFALGADKVGYPLWSLQPDGTHKLNPENATLYTDLAGVLHLQGVEAKGDIYANNFYFNDGGNIKTLLSETQKTIPSKYISVYGLNVLSTITGLPTFTIDTNGNVSMHSGSITWDSPVIEYQYSVDNTSWHSQETATDKYRREKQVGGTWKAGYQYKGIDGAPGSNGSDGDPRGYLRSIGVTEITSGSVKSPRIEGGELHGADIYGGSYFDLNGIGKLNLSDVTGGYSDLRFSNARNGYNILVIGDNIGGATMSLYGHNLASASASGIRLADGVEVIAKFG